MAVFNMEKRRDESTERFYLNQLVDVIINLCRQVHPSNSLNRLNISTDRCDRKPLHLRLSAVSALGFLISSHTKILKCNLHSCWCPSVRMSEKDFDGVTKWLQKSENGYITWILRYKARLRCHNRDTNARFPTQV